MLTQESLDTMYAREARMPSSYSRQWGRETDTGLGTWIGPSIPPTLSQAWGLHPRRLPRYMGLILVLGSIFFFFRLLSDDCAISAVLLFPILIGGLLLSWVSYANHRDNEQLAELLQNRREIPLPTSPKLRRKNAAIRKFEQTSEESARHAERGQDLEAAHEPPAGRHPIQPNILRWPGLPIGWALVVFALCAGEFEYEIITPLAALTYLSLHLLQGRLRFPQVAVDFQKQVLVVRGREVPFSEVVYGRRIELSWDLYTVVTKIWDILPKRTSINLPPAGSRRWQAGDPADRREVTPGNAAEEPGSLLRLPAGCAVYARGQSG